MITVYVLFHRPIIKVTDKDNALGVLPFFHIYGMSPVMMGVLQDGGTLITQPKFDPEQFLTALMKHKVSSSDFYIFPNILKVNCTKKINEPCHAKRAFSVAVT